MHREQTHYFRGWGTEAASWLSLILLALAVTWLPSAGWSAALAETETPAPQTIKQQPAEQQATKTQEPQQESPEQDDKAADKADDKSDSEADSEDESKAAKDGKEKQADEQSKKNPNEAGDSKDSQETKTMKQSEDSSEAAKPEGDGKATVEAERLVEVDPPKQETKQPKENPDPSMESKKKKCIIGATATLLEKQSELKFRARVDSGAKSCSLHIEKIKIEDESKQEDIAERMTENIGKVIHFEVKNGDDKMHILTSKIAGYVIIKNSNKKEGKRRYKVPLTFRWKHLEKEVLVTLTDRNHMDYPLLLGRNFLRGDFLVDVELNSDD